MWTFLVYQDGFADRFLIFFLAGCLTHIAQSWIQSPVTDVVPPPALAGFYQQYPASCKPDPG